jgi:hypothetical protein
VRKLPFTEHFAYFSLKNFFGSTSPYELSVLKFEDIEFDWGRFGMGEGVCVVGDVDDPFMPARRFCVLLVLPLPKPWRLKKDIFGQSHGFHGRAEKSAGCSKETGQGGSSGSRVFRFPQASLVCVSPGTWMR